MVLEEEEEEDEDEDQDEEDQADVWMRAGQGVKCGHLAGAATAAARSPIGKGKPREQ